MKLFGRKDPKQQVKDSRKDVRDNIREVDRELMVGCDAVTAWLLLYYNNMRFILFPLPCRVYGERKFL